MAGVGENNDRKAAQERHCALWLNQSQRASIHHGITLDKVRKNQYHEVADGYQGDDARIFQGVQTP